MNDNLGNFVVPTICEFDNVAEITKSEAFVPILYTMKFKVKLSWRYTHTYTYFYFGPLMRLLQSIIQFVKASQSSLFTSDPAAIFKWTGPSGSDCGIVNEHSTNGAEIGGAFGGEKETGMGEGKVVVILGSNT